MVTGQAVKGGQQTADLAEQLAERTSDLQRLQAEYANYRKRVDRDRAAVREQAVAATLTGLLPVLDTINQAREHGELSGGFKSVADPLHAAVCRLGLVTYGEKGDPFDPKIHEALTSSYSADVAEDTCVEISSPATRSASDPATRPGGCRGTRYRSRREQQRARGTPLKRRRKLSSQRGKQRLKGTRTARVVSPASRRGAVPSGLRSEELATSDEGERDRKAPRRRAGQKSERITQDEHQGLSREGLLQGAWGGQDGQAG